MEAPHEFELTSLDITVQQQAQQRTFLTELQQDVRYTVNGFIGPSDQGDKIGHGVLGFIVIDVLQASQDPVLQEYCLQGKGTTASRLKSAVARISLLLYPNENTDLHAFQKFLSNVFGRSADVKELSVLRDRRCTGEQVPLADFISAWERAVGPEKWEALTAQSLATYANLPGLVKFDKCILIPTSHLEELIICAIQEAMAQDETAFGSPARPSPSTLDRMLGELSSRSKKLLALLNHIQRKENERQTEQLECSAARNLNAVLLADGKETRVSVQNLKLAQIAQEKEAREQKKVEEGQAAVRRRDQGRAAADKLFEQEQAAAGRREEIRTALANQREENCNESGARAEANEKLAAKVDHLLVQANAEAVNARQHTPRTPVHGQCAPARSQGAGTLVRAQGTPSRVQPPAHAEGTPARVQHPTRAQGTPARVQPPARAQGTPARVQPPARAQGTPARGQPPARSQGTLASGQRAPLSARVAGTHPFLRSSKRSSKKPDGL